MNYNFFIGYFSQFLFYFHMYIYLIKTKKIENLIRTANDDVELVFGLIFTFVYLKHIYHLIIRLSILNTAFILFIHFF